MLLKRSPLPTTIQWHGEPDDLERFIDRFTGHVNQQPHMGHLLLPETHNAWMVLGNARAVLAWGLSRNLHSSLPFMSPSQFVQDLQWLCGAMLQSIMHRGRVLVKKCAATQDGIAAWHHFLKVHHHGGNANVHLNTQQQIVTAIHHEDCAGVPLACLEAVEDAFNNTNCKGFPLCADDVKRLMFIQNATTHATADSLERTEQSTDTWDAFATALRLALARCQSCNATSNQQIGRAHV